MSDDTAVGQIHVAMGLLLETQSVLHPVDIVTVGVVLAGVSTTRLLPVGGGGSGLGAVEFGQYNSSWSVKSVTVLGQGE